MNAAPNPLQTFIHASSSPAHGLIPRKEFASWKRIFRLSLAPALTLATEVRLGEQRSPVTLDLCPLCLLSSIRQLSIQYP
jgi:hypothetical protein